MNTEKSIDVLNTLIEINNDRFECYETASKETDESDLISLFFEFQEKSQKRKAELIEEVQKLGGKPIQETNFTKRFLRIWLDIRASFGNKNREELLNCCEYDEDLAVKTYKNVLKDNWEHLTLSQQNMLKAQQQSIKMDHDILKNLGDLLLNHREYT